MLVELVPPPMSDYAVTTQPAGRSSLRRLAGTLRVLRHLPGQTRVPYLSPERAVARRDARVREAVRFAAAHVPFYRDALAERGLDPREVRTAEDLALLPSIDRSLLQSQPERFRPDLPVREDVLAFPTSGSTGAPVRLLHDRASLLENIAHGERERAVEIHFGGRRYGYPVLQISHPETADRRIREYYGRVSFRPLRPRLHPLTVADSVETIAEALATVRPLVVRGFGTHLDLLFRTAVARGLELHLPKLVVYGGDAMPEGGRRLLEEELGVPVISRYGASEAFKIAFMCEARTGFHLHEDLTHVAVVGSDGRPLPDGEIGEIAVSNLVNRGMLLLNYRLGDLGRLGGRDCPCGRTGRLLTSFEGRVDETIRIGGRVVHPVLVRAAMDQPGVLRFQLLQEAETAFRLRLVVAESAAFERLATGIAAELRGVLPGATITPERHDELRPEPGARKFRPVLPLGAGGGA